MDISCLAVGYLETNCYIVSSGLDCLVIDPGDDAGEILSVIRDKGLRVHAILITHGHFDHFMAAGELQKAFGVPVYIGKDDADLLRDPGWMSEYMSPGYTAPRDLRTLSDGDTVSAGELSFQVMSAPGHSPGSVCFHSPGVLFSGDLLFMGSIGRTDLPGGNSIAIRESLAKVGRLAGDTAVYPGHGPSTTVGEEKTSNPYMD